MGAEAIKSVAEKLREMYEFAKGDYIYTYINFEDEQEFDLGQFGYRSTEIAIERDEYSLDAADILDKFPITTSGFEELADQLDELAEAADQLEEAENGDVDLETVLFRMSENGDKRERALVEAIRAVIDLSTMSQEAVVAGIGSNGVSTGALPPKPLPWPGALRPEIDYTADDFPLRYNPPPGWSWVKGGSQTTKLEPGEAEAFDAVGLQERKMILTNQGEISWIKRGDDDLSSGKRWSIWFYGSNGFPASGGNFTNTTMPLALDADGQVIGVWTDSDGRNSDASCAPWRSTSDKEKALALVQKIRAEQGLYEVRTVNAYGVDYDPKTVPLNPETGISVTPEQLRPGDNITGYGRVLKLKKDGPMYQLVVFSDSGDETTFRDERTSWYIEPIKVPNRDAVPTALSISEGRPSPISYDPLTVPLSYDESGVKTSELRPGEDITGDEFGRVVSVVKDGSQFVITMNRDGRINERRDSDDIEWSVLTLAGDRDSVPTALSLSGTVPTVDYDPLTVPLRSESSINVRADDLRLGEDIVGGSFGRVTGIEMNGTVRELVLNRNGRERRFTFSPSQTWAILKLDREDRDSVPTAIELSKAVAPILF